MTDPHISTPLRRLSRCTRGTSVVELGIVLPLFALLVLGLVCVAITVGKKLRLQQAVARSLEMATAGGIDNADPTGIQQEAATAAGVPASAGSGIRWRSSQSLGQGRRVFAFTRPGDRASQDFALGDGLNASVGGNLSYVGRRTGSFQPDPTRSIFPDYWQLDLTAGLNWDDWRLNAFVTNVTNTRGVLRSGLDSNLPTLITYIRPRSFGLSLTRSF